MKFSLLTLFLTVCCDNFQELTKLRITKIEGIDKSETVAVAA